jgi:hypothetical protein
MKLKQYLGALLMAGSVLAVSFPAEAMSGKQIQRPFKGAISLVKSIGKSISKPVVDDRAIDLRPPDTTKQITDYIHKDPTKLSQLVSNSAVEQTPPTEIEKEPSQNISKYVMSGGGAITVAYEACAVYLKPQNANSERVQIRVSGVRISPVCKSALTLLGKKLVCDLLLDDPVYVGVTVLQPDACPATKETRFIRKRLGYQN